MATLLLFALLFLFSLLNSLFSPKLLALLRSLLLSSAPAPGPAPKPPPTPKPLLPPSLQSLFSTFDSDGDGFISPSELLSSLRRLGLDASSADDLIRSLDANGDGLIDLAEFRDLYASIASEPDAAAAADDREIRDAFEIFDGNGDGLITADELSLVLKSLGLAQGEDQAEACREMIDRVDLDGDGMVNFQEFKRMICF